MIRDVIWFDVMGEKVGGDDFDLVGIEKRE